MKTNLPIIYKQNKGMKQLGVLLMVLLLLTAVYSCDDFTAINMPISELNQSDVFEQKNTAEAAMTDIYAKIRDNGMLTGKTTGISKEMGLYADELTFWRANTEASAFFYTNTLQPANTRLPEWWNAAYSAIYSANAVAEGVKASTKLLQADSNQLAGEALFVRALMHFYLLQLYGPIPYITTTNYQVNTKVSRKTEKEVYLKIIEDLSQAEELLSQEYPTQGRVRPNVYAVKALLARVYLYNGNWAEAAEKAAAVLNNTSLYSWEEDLDLVFLKESSTAIWQLIPGTGTQNTDEAFTFIFTAGPPPSISLSKELMHSFETGDVRKEKWTKAITDGSSTWYHAYKYKKPGTSTPSSEYAVVLRLAEMYLIRAEARAQQSELINAKEDLNKIRTRAGLPPTTAQTKNEILTAILKERRVEFFTEYGSRFMDLKRNAQLDAQLQNVKPAWNTTDQLLPVPQSELQLNPNLAPQNPGY